VLCAYCYSPEHVTEDFPDLLKKWEDKKGNCNMVHVEPCKNQKKKGEVNIWVVTHGGEKTGADFQTHEKVQVNKQREISGRPPNPLLSLMQLNKVVLCDAQ
jgi:hypothetical protein